MIVDLNTSRNQRRRLSHLASKNLEFTITVGTQSSELGVHGTPKNNIIDGLPGCDGLALQVGKHFCPEAGDATANERAYTVGDTANCIKKYVPVGCRQQDF